MDNNYDKKLREHRRRKMLAIVLSIVAIATIVVAIFLFYKYKKFDKYIVNKTIALNDVADCIFYEYGDYILKYSNDGITYIKGDKIIWNQPFEMKTPLVDICENCVAIAEVGGNKIYIYGKNGMYGEISTQYPIANLEVSKYGVVAVITEGLDADYYEIYDKDGKKLVEGISAFEGDGKPIDISLSNDGTKMVASYIYMDNGKLKSKVAFYNFSEVGKDNVNRLVGVFSHYDEMIVPKIEFISNSKVVTFAENMVTFYAMKQKPSKVAEIKVDEEIQHIFYSEGYVGLIVRNPVKEDEQRLLVYDAEGKMRLDKSINKEYINAKIDGDNIVLFNEKKVLIVSVTGVKKYEGEFEEEVLDVMTTKEEYEYILITSSGIKEIELQ